MSSTNARLSVAVLFALAACSRSPAPSSPRAVEPAPIPEPTCTPDLIEVTRIDAGFERACKGDGCLILKGTATVQNRCPHPVGVEFSITLKDAGGAPLATRSLWLNSIRNLPVGESVLPLDAAIEYRRGADSVVLTPVRTKVW